MTRKTRFILLSLFVFLYLVVAPILICYSLGYRLDFDKKKLVSTGGVYLKIWPQESQISIGEKINKKTSIFSNELLVQGLLPKKYKIIVKKDGYYDWEKNLEIESQKVNRIENVTLIKEGIFFEISKEKINNFYISPNRDLILLLGSNQRFSLVNSQTKIEENSFFLPEVIKNDVDIFSWDENTDIIILEAEGNYFSVDYNKTGVIEPKKISLKDSNKLVSDAKLTFKKEDAYIYLLNPETNKFDGFYQAKDITFSPDKSRFLFFNDHEILFAESKTPNQRNFLMRFSEKINNCFWLNNNYIIFDVAGSVKISEIDTRDKINMVDLGTKINLTNNSFVESKNPKIFFDEINKKLYILNKNTLFISEPLTDKNNK